MLYSSEFRNKKKRGMCVCVPRAAVRPWQKPGAPPPPLKGPKAAAEGPFCAGGVWFGQNSLLLEIMFSLTLNQSGTVGCPWSCHPMPNNVIIEGNLVSDVFPLLLTYICSLPERTLLSASHIVRVRFTLFNFKHLCLSCLSISPYPQWREKNIYKT